ncbi:[protein-PII] uridylyltransferase [Desulfosarcina sp. OttesenSCG-928-A07]|nr:[protein-PII] uridylyltransferase [Desulfosarcina sp. OttesenSCG-928-G17]MDL2330182.1 [protein-PII] uridylyltransferase [Desulfosarcina sp. OttesenSCG-928-A07]
MTVPEQSYIPETPQEEAAAILKTERGALVQKLVDNDAPAFLEDHTRLLDDYFRRCYEKSTVGLSLDIAKNPYAIVALGGYGRSEQCVYSDVDLLFLFEKRVPPSAGALVEEMLYPLWDLGIEVGHATRSIRDCLTLGRQDLESLTAMLDARFICGMSTLFVQLTTQLRTRLIQPRTDAIISSLVESNHQRHRRFGDSAYLLEPNFKEGQGGLRDYHTLLWIAKIRAGIKTRADLAFYDYFSHDDYTDLIKSLDFIWNIRNRYHLMMRRKADQLYLEQQVRLAEEMHIPELGGRLPVERLLGMLHSHMEYIKQLFSLFLYEMEQRKRFQRKNSKLKTATIKGLAFNQGMLSFTAPEKILRNPLLLIDIFSESAAQKAPLSNEAKRLISDFSDLMDDRFRSDPQVVQRFDRILTRSSRTFEVLNQMLSTGFLVHFIPEFRDIVNRIQFDQYHLYPVGRHLLYTVKIMRGFGARPPFPPDPLAVEIYGSIRRKKPLIWAALLHDIGKGSPARGHSKRGALMAKRILEEKGFRPVDIKTVVFLVENHLLLADTATRRDINDERTAIVLAQTVRNMETLKMLYLLTVADSMATGPKAWNEWTASLFRDLFFKARNILESGEMNFGRAVRLVEKKRQAILELFGTLNTSEPLETLLNFMSPRYIVYAPVEKIPEHLELYASLGENPFVWRIDRDETAHTRIVTLCAKDRPGLISRIAGVFTLNSIDILDVQVFTWRNNIALDVFTVKPPPDPIFEDERWERTRRELEEALAGRLDLRAVLGAALTEKKNSAAPFSFAAAERPTRIVVDNETTSFYTIVEIITYNVPGLLFWITDTLLALGLDIWVAKIATKVDQVVDVFYVRDFDGQRVDTQPEVDALKAAIRTVLTDPTGGVK